MPNDELKYLFKGAVFLIGRPNVGKSSIFNKLTKTKDALVADQPGVTRDWRMGYLHVPESDRKTQHTAATPDSADAEDEATDSEHEDKPIPIIDCAGIVSPQEQEKPYTHDHRDHNLDSLAQRIGNQMIECAKDAALVLLITDAKNPLSSLDFEIADFLRRYDRNVWHIVNKIDGQVIETALGDHSELGFKETHLISAKAGRGLTQVRDRLIDWYGEFELPLPPRNRKMRHLLFKKESSVIQNRVMFLGRPNCGKSTLFNRFAAFERAVVSELPGTTRDDITQIVPISTDKGQKVLEVVDTSGVSRRFKANHLDRLATYRTKQRIFDTDLAVVLIDGTAGVVDQDRRLLGEAMERGRGVLIAVNKADVIRPSVRKEIMRDLTYKMPFAKHIPNVIISALTGTGMKKFYEQIIASLEEVESEPGTAWLNRILERVVRNHPPPAIGRDRIKLRFAHPRGYSPLRISIFGTRLEQLPEHYVRYLEAGFREELGLRSQPVRMELSSVSNPYAPKDTNKPARGTRKGAKRYNRKIRSIGRRVS